MMFAAGREIDGADDGRRVQVAALCLGTFKEIGSGVKLDRAERRKVMALAQARHIDAVLVTELSRWGRSTTDLLASR